MIQLIKNKKFCIIFLLFFLVMISLHHKAQAASSTMSYDFHCGRHGHNDFKDCGGEWQDLPRSDYTSAATSFQFLGHRHGSSSIAANACVTGSNLPNGGQCQWFLCSGAACGEEYGDEHQWKFLDGGTITLSAVGGTSNARLYHSAAVMDAEVRVVGTANAYYNDSLPPIGSPFGAVDGGWSDCSVTCGGGTRTCTNPAPTGGGAECSGLSSCNTQACATPPGGCVTNPVPGTACSISNSCGSATNVGTRQCDGSCNAAIPSESSCTPIPPTAGMSGTLTPATPSCVIPIGQSSCSIDFSWTTIFN